MNLKKNEQVALNFNALKVKEQFIILMLLTGVLLSWDQSTFLALFSEIPN